MSEAQRYFAYLLRLWQTNRDGKPVWWASLEVPGTHQQFAFTDLQALFAFLEKCTQEDARTQSHSDDDQQAVC